MGPDFVDPIGAGDVEDWIPRRVVWEQHNPFVDCCYLGGTRFSEPFFQDTIARALCRPFSAAFLRRASMEALEQEVAGEPDPAGLIFHMSRCGSTLISQMLKAIAGVTVFSEPPPVDTIARAPEFGIQVTEEQHADWLRCIVRALGRGGAAGRRAYVLKLDCWHVMDLPMFQRAFPKSPWIFLYRDPIEVLASHASIPAEWTLPGYLKADRFGFDPNAVAPAALAEYRTLLLRGMLRSVLDYSLNLGKDQGGHLVNYSQLPYWGWTQLPQRFGLDPTPQEIGAMQAVAMLEAERSATGFAPHAERRRADATPEIQALSETHLDPLYRELEKIRNR
jgi:hypothetical protein